MGRMPAVELIPATTDAHYAAGARLFRDYARELAVDLCFQGFEAELTRLPQMYGPPQGALLLGEIDGVLVGCVGVRARSAGTCEMKRLYVAPGARGTGLGRRLATASIEAARGMGYQHMVLDTLETLTAALALYASLGFEAVAPYYANPLPGVVYLSLRLT